MLLRIFVFLLCVVVACLFVFCFVMRFVTYDVLCCFGCYVAFVCVCVVVLGAFQFVFHVVFD